jgi:trigger factor
MGLVETKKIDTNKYEFTVEVPPERFEKALNTAYMKARGKIQVNGFRKGKAPRKTIERIYGTQCFYEDAVNIIVQDDVEKAMQNADVELVAPPEIAVDQIGTDTGVRYKLIGFSKPDVTVNDYKGISVNRTIASVTDEDIDADIDNMRHKSARIITIEDRPSQMGDTVVIDFIGYKDGVQFDGGTEFGYSLKLGSNSFIPGFEEQCCGKNSGDVFNIDVTFPENYQMKELAGSPAVFEITLHEIQTEEMPELDDDFVKDVSDFDTVDELKDDIRNKRELAALKNADAKAEDEIFKIIADQITEEIPAVMVEQKIDVMMREFAYRVQMQGFDLNTYCAFTGNSLESLREQHRERALLQVKIRLALEKIAELENIEITDERVDEEIQKMADTYKTTAEKVREIIVEKELRKDIACAEAFEIVLKSAVII